MFWIRRYVRKSVVSRSDLIPVVGRKFVTLRALHSVGFDRMRKRAVSNFCHLWYAEESLRFKFRAGYRANVSGKIERSESKADEKQAYCETGCIRFPSVTH
jgi:hypothetical protein